jgi:hypothetical protein
LTAANDQLWVEVERLRCHRRDDAACITGLRAEIERLRAVLQAALDWHDGYRNDGEWVGMARRALQGKE